MKHKDQIKKALWHILMLLCLEVYVFGLVLVCEATGRQEFATFRTFIQTEIGHMALINTSILAFLLILALYCLIRRIGAAMLLVSVPVLICNLISAFKLQLRNEPFYPWDITLAGEVTNIISSIRLHPSRTMLLAIGYVAASVVIAFVLDQLVLRRYRLTRKSYLTGFSVAMVYFCLLCGAWFNESYIAEHTIPVRVYNQRWTYEENGFFYAFVSNAYHARIDAPEDYSADTIQTLAGGCEASGGSVEPNVIIVMSEAFSDIWNAQGLRFDRELAPAFTSLSEQYLSGRCMTSEYGGNTANCEFEVLTGYSTWLLPSGTVPYMSHMNRDTDCYVSYLLSQGYHTVALHPYQRSFFSREKAYELMGFEEFYSEEHFEGAERFRYMKYVSDDAVADRIIEEFEKNQQTDRGFFCHTVTMLNHTSYHDTDWPDEVQVGMEADCELTDKEYGVLRCYATGVMFADEMLAKLVDYFSAVEEPTVIVFFGDHQPSLGTPGYELMQRIGYVEDNTTAEGILKLQSTPYLIWNNFQQEPTAAKMDLSMFQMIPYMTRMLDMDRPAFHGYLDSLFEQTRGVTRQVSLDGSGNAVLSLEGEAQAAFEEYLDVVYDGLLGKQYASPLLYP